MEPSPDPQALDLFEQASELAADEREAFLARACAGREPLRARVDALLAADEDGPESLASSTDLLARLAECPAAHAELATPERIGPYRILRRAGIGGMGIVFEAEQDTPRRRVALKVLRPLLRTPEREKRFQLEAEVLGQLQHEGIARIYDAGTFELVGMVQPYLAMEFIDGVDLISYAQRERLDLRARLKLIARVAEAVEHAHARSIVHRDLKPENVLVDASGAPKVLDFGVARVTSSLEGVSAMQTSEGQVVGTLNYMAPEQLRGEMAAIGPASDVFALGVLTFELLAGRPPIETRGLPSAAAVRVLLESSPARLSRTRSGVDSDVDTIVQKALEPDPRRRYASAGELAADLWRKLDERPIAARPPSRIDALRKLVRRNRGLATGLGLSFLVLIGATIAVSLLAANERAALKQAGAANQRAFSASLEMWRTERRRAPRHWADEVSEQAASEALGMAESAIASGTRADGLIRAVGRMSEARQLHEGAVPRLLPLGLEAVRAGRVEDARETLARARECGVPDETLEPLAAELCLSRLRMLPIPAGEFVMGDDYRAVGALAGQMATKLSYGQPLHTVRFARGFWMSATEITQGQFLATLGRNTSGNPGDLERPVEQVTWYDALEFCNELSRRQGRSPCYALSGLVRTARASISQAEVQRITGTGYRLPSAAEWEYACRAGSQTSYFFGEASERMDEFGWCRTETNADSQPVGSKAPNVFGLFDMHGNVWEWCEDCWRRDDESWPIDGSALWRENSSERRVLRGGACYLPALEARAGRHTADSAASRYHYRGMRIVRDLDDLEAGQQSPPTGSREAPSDSSDPGTPAREH